jgi:exopolysaccharide biosynthesis polyprenyl glycosylphosphotransferase
MSTAAIAHQEATRVRTQFRSRRHVGAFVAVARFTVVWIPVYVIVDKTAMARVGTATVISAIIWLAILAVRGATRSTLLALGAGAPTALGVIGGVVIVIAVGALNDALRLPPRLIVAGSVAVFLMSMLWEGTVAARGLGRQRVLILGTDGGGSDLGRELATSPDLRFELVGVVREEALRPQPADASTDADKPRALPTAGGPEGGRIADFRAVIRDGRPDIVVLAAAGNRPKVFEALVQESSSGFSVLGLPQFYEHAFGLVPVRHLTHAWFMSVIHAYRSSYSSSAKRIFDVTVASAGLALTAPLFPILALLIRCTSLGPILHRQQRLGENAQVFTMYKFRTMRGDAEQPLKAVWALKCDPRVTRIGKVLRRTRLDELPQLVNVLRGEMSIVGPRPERPEFFDELRRALPFWSERHQVKPGITGWAQIRCGYTASADETYDKLSFDLWYLRHRSLLVDVAICVKTFATLATGAGAR